MDDAFEPTPWWGTYALEENTGGEWDIGPSTLWVYRARQDWRVVHRPSTDPVTADPMAQRSDVHVPLEKAEMRSVLEAEDKELTTNRYSVRHTNEQIALQPLLADRPVVSRPEHPISVLPGEAVTLYLSTPLWVRVALVESERRLQEVPSHRMSDTWFGASTREGELCYATRTAGRLQLDKLPRRLHRALTPLQVRNRAKDALTLERIQLPAQHLALYVTSADVIWTPTVTMTRREGDEGAFVQIKEGPPREADGADLLQKPRDLARQ